jgi:hypothetical protein
MGELGKMNTLLTIMAAVRERYFYALKQVSGVLRLDYRVTIP